MPEAAGQPGRLRGLAVLVTRPREEAAGLARAIEAAGGAALGWPAIEIEALDDIGPARRCLAGLRPGETLVFVSRNAVRHGWPLLPGQLPAGALTLVAVGRGTAAALHALGASQVHVPAGRADSDGMLALPVLAPARVRGQRVVIVRGRGGREALAEGLRARGARVEYAEVYARRPARAPLGPRLRGSMPGATVVTSAEALEHWVGQVRYEGLEALLQRPLVLVSERLRERARALGVAGPLTVATGADSTALVEALCAAAASGAGVRTDGAPAVGELGGKES